MSGATNEAFELRLTHSGEGKSGPYWIAVWVELLVHVEQYYILRYMGIKKRSIIFCWL